MGLIFQDFNRCCMPGLIVEDVVKLSGRERLALATWLFTKKEVTEE